MLLVPGNCLLQSWACCMYATLMGKVEPTCPGMRIKVHIAVFPLPYFSLVSCDDEVGNDVENCTKKETYLK